MDRGSKRMLLDTPGPWIHDVGRFPRTRYQGSKRRLARRIVEETLDLDYQTVLDAFGGTGSVSYAFKCAGKRVTYNDVLEFNRQIGRALVENAGIHIEPDDLSAWLGSFPCSRSGFCASCDPGDVEEPPGLKPGARDTESGDAPADDGEPPGLKPGARDTESGDAPADDDARAPGLIETTFAGIYFTDDENRWLDRTVGRLRATACPVRRAMGYFCLFQSAMAKRPYNLFHRRNLYMRFADVPRGFGNKTSWDRPFAEHFRHFARQANGAVFDGGRACHATCADVMTIEPTHDLVYIDPPYVTARGIGVDYRGFYHFLEGIMNYDRWSELIDERSRHRRLIPVDNPWTRPDPEGRCFRGLFDRFRGAILVVSYRSDGIPRVDQLERWLGQVKRRVRTIALDARPYTLSRNRRTREMLLIGTD